MDMAPRVSWCRWSMTRRRRGRSRLHEIRSEGKRGAPGLRDHYLGAVTESSLLPTGAQCRRSKPPLVWRTRDEIAALTVSTVWAGIDYLPAWSGDFNHPKFGRLVAHPRRLLEALQPY
jgi:hypothetical protein